MFIVIPTRTIERGDEIFFKDFEYDFDSLEKIPKVRGLKIYKEPDYCFRCGEDCGDWLCLDCGHVHTIEEWDRVIRTWRLIGF